MMPSIKKGGEVGQQIGCEHYHIYKNIKQSLGSNEFNICSNPHLLLFKQHRRSQFQPTHISETSLG